MAKKIPIPYPIVEVIWDDASSTPSGAWVAISDLAKPERINTTGFLVHEGNDHISVAASVAAEGESETVNSTVTIPKGMIVSRREVRITSVRRKSQDKLHTEPVAETIYREQSKG